MSGKESDVIGGVNKFLDDQKKLPDPATIAFVRFDTGHIERFRPMQNLAEAQHLTSEDFQPRGGTPLLDAVGQTIAGLDDDWKREQPERAIVVIVTDGQENASSEYTKAKIKEMIEARQASGKWAFIYLGANVDSFAEAGSMGIAMANTANYHATKQGFASAYDNMSNTVVSMRATGATIATNLGGDINEDGTVTQRSHTVSQMGNPSTWVPPQKTGTWNPPQ